MLHERLRETLSVLPKTGEVPSGRTASLQNLLSDELRREAEVIHGLDFSDIQGVLATETGLVLPDYLATEMNLKGYEWSHIASRSRNNLPLLFVAGEKDRNRPYDDALATLVIDRHIANNDRTHLDCIRVAGVMADHTGRKNAVGIKYNPRGNRAYWIDVVGEEGYSKVGFPSTYHDPNIVAGLISKGMIDELQLPAEPKVVTAYDSETNGTYFSISGLEWRGTFWFSPERLISTNGMHTLKLGTSQENLRLLSLPAQLTKI